MKSISKLRKGRRPARRRFIGQGQTARAELAKSVIEDDDAFEEPPPPFQRRGFLVRDWGVRGLTK